MTQAESAAPAVGLIVDDEPDEPKPDKPQLIKTVGHVGRVLVSAGSVA